MFRQKTVRLFLGLILLLTIFCTAQAAVIYVAASDSSSVSKSQANYVCDGVNDHIEIQSAINSARSGDTIHLFEGHFNTAARIVLKANTIFEGSGEGATIIKTTQNSAITTGNVAPYTTIQDLRLTGSGGIEIHDSNVNVNRVTAYKLDNKWIGSFVVYAYKEVLENIHFTDCKAIDCNRWGFVNMGESTPKLIRNSSWKNCQAINCGRYGHFVGYAGDPGWDVGFDITENTDVENLLYENCLAEGTWESGFHSEPGAINQKNVRLVNCISRNNGQKYKTIPGLAEGEYFGAGYMFHLGSPTSSITLENCVAEDNVRGFSIRQGTATLTNCKESGSLEAGYRLYMIDNGYSLSGCSSTNSKQPVTFITGATHNVLIDGISIQSPVKQSTAAILIESNAENPSEILIKNSQISGYTIGIKNIPTWKGLCKVQNTIVLGADQNVVGCEILSAPSVPNPTPTPVPNQPPTLSSIGNKNVNEGSTLTFVVSAQDPEQSVLTYSTINIPSGASFNPATRTFSWSPTYSQAGSYQMSFSVSDGRLSDSETITIKVANVNRPPVLDPIGPKSVSDGETLRFTVTGSDPDGNTLMYGATNLPVGAAFNPDTRVFTWTPLNQAGTYSSIRFTVSDGQLTDVEVVTVTVTVKNTICIGTCPTPTPTPLQPTPTITPVVTPSQTANGGGAAGGAVPFFPIEEPGGVVDNYYSLSMTGTEIILTESGQQKILVNLLAMGEDVSVYNKKIISRTPYQSLTIETENQLNPVGNILEGIVSGVQVETTPILIEDSLTEGKFTFSLSTYLNIVPMKGVGLNIETSDTPADQAVQLLQSSLVNSREYVSSLGVGIHVSPLGNVPDGPTKISISAPTEWVVHNGGKNFIRIFQVSEEGMVQMLDTKFSGFDQFGNLVFIGQTSVLTGSFYLGSIVLSNPSQAQTTSTITQSEQPVTSSVAIPEVSSVLPASKKEEKKAESVLARGIVVGGVGIAGLAIMKRKPPRNKKLYNSLFAVGIVVTVLLSHWILSILSF